jgi:hypothetical protein
LQQPREHGIAHGLGYGIERRREQLAHEKGIAFGNAVDVARVAQGAFRELFHGGERQRRHRDARHVLSRQLAEDAPQQMRESDLVVAKGRHHQASCALDTSPHEPHEVESGLIRPVQVLEHYDALRIRRRELLEQSRKKLVARQLGIEHRANLGGEFFDGPKHAGGLKCVAMTPIHRRAGREARELLHQRALAGARLPANERHFAGALSRFSQKARELIELFLSLQKVHTASEYPTRYAVWARVPQYG